MNKYLSTLACILLTPLMLAAALPAATRAESLSELKTKQGEWEAENGITWSRAGDGEGGKATLPVEASLPVELTMDVHVENPAGAKNPSAFVKLVDDRGTGYGIRFFSPKPWHVSVVRLTNGRQQGGRTSRKLIQYVLNTKNFNGRMSLKLLADRRQGQLYLGFFGQPPRYIHGAMPGREFRPTKLTFKVKNVALGFSDLRIRHRRKALPDLHRRRKVGGDMPTWGGFAGSHHYTYQSESGDRLLFRNWLRLHRGSFNPVVDKEKAGNRWVVKYEGPFNGGPVYIDHYRVRDFIGRAAEKRAKIVINVDPVPWGRDGNEKVNVKNHQNRIYWTVRSVLEAPGAEKVDILWQQGNEVNFGAHAGDYRMRPMHIRPYVEQAFAPAVVAIRRASRDALGDPNAAMITNGSLAAAGAADSLSWMHMFLNTKIKGTHNADQLAGSSPLDVIDILSIHYVMKGAYWRKSLNTIYDLYVKDGDVDGVWSTEEFGGTSAQISGPFAITLAFRYMDWWSRRDWKRNRGAMFYWGDWMGRERYPTAFFFQQLMTRLVDSRDLQNRTPGVKAAGSKDLEAYSFGTQDQRKQRFVAGVFSSEYYIAGNPDLSGSSRVRNLSIPVESERPYRVLVRVFKPNTVERVYDRTVAPRDGRLKISLDETLEHIRREALLVTGAVQPGSFPEVFEKVYTEQEEESRFIPYGETVSFYWGNWGTAPMGGMDKGMDGDGHGLLATKWYEEPIFPIELQRDYSGGPAEMIIEVDGWPPGKADLFWDGEVLARGISTKRGKKPFDVPAGVDLSPGEHRFKIVMQDGRVFRVDTLTIRQKR